MRGKGGGTGSKKMPGGEPPGKSCLDSEAFFDAMVYCPSDFSGAPRSCEFTNLQTSFTALESHWVCVA
jgi:hypothetical protein